jgi:hypothetical protein
VADKKKEGSDYASSADIPASILEWAGGKVGKAVSTIKRRRNDVDEQVEGKSRTRSYD